MNIKKGYSELYAFLELNKGKKINTVMPEIVAIMSRKNNASGLENTFIKDVNGDVVAIFCYYHKKWEFINECEYGSKANTATGLNTMCKEGVSNWTKQQRIKKKSLASLLDDVAKGDLAIEDIPAKQDEIALESIVIKPREDGLGEDEVSVVQAVADDVIAKDEEPTEEA